MCVRVCVRCTGKRRPGPFLCIFVVAFLPWNHLTGCSTHPYSRPLCICPMSLRSFSDPIPQPDVSRGALPQLPVPASAPPTSNFPLGSILAPQALAPQIAIPYFGPHPADLSTVPMAIPIHGFWPATPGYLYASLFPVPNQHWANTTGPLPSTYCQGNSSNLLAIMG